MTIKNTHFNILLGLNSFLVFFLIFEDSIQVPVFLQVIGRMHPLLLHFPIVLFIITWLLFSFRLRLEKEIPNIKPILHLLLFISSLLIVVTAIMGLLLSKEGGFEGSSYEWHKYTGIGLSLLSLGLLGYIRFTKKDSYPAIFSVGIHISMLVLLLVGHYGASLTHGEDFITAPIISKPSKELDVESAIVFEDAVLPILQAKCMSCHSSSKAKGNLILSDSSSILKGGKNGQLFLAGEPMKSLMIERLLLDIENQHRMPPKGKPQLSIDEISLLKAWVKSGGKFDVPLSAFNEQDSLYQSVKAVYGFEKAEVYTFAAADAKDIQKLNTPYRIINTLDATSPALDVNFFGKDFFNEQSLSELLPIAEQVVSLNLSSMPITHKDIQSLKKFINLRNLKLNNSKLSNEDVSLLSELKNLKYISLIGTDLKKDGLEKLAGMTSIRKVYVWNTPIKEDEIASIKKKFPALKIDAGVKLDESIQLALTAPKITPARSFFQKEALVSITHPVKEVNFFYTIDGTDPDSSATAKQYEAPFTVQKDVLLRVKGKKEGWLPSQEVRQHYFATFLSPQKVLLETRPNPQYKGRKEKSFFDLESGGSNNADGNWLGFQGADFSASLLFDNPVQVDTLALSIKQEYGQHIYAPEFIEVWGGADSTKLKLLNKVKLEMDRADQMRNRRLLVCPLPSQSLSVIRIKTKHYPKIPEGFPGGGAPPWLFVDEIILK